jgi:hypothetical protein
MRTEFRSFSSLSFPIQSKILESQLLCLPSAFTPISFSAYSLTLMMEAICSSKTSVHFQWTTQHISEDSTLHYTICLDYAAYIESNKDNCDWLILGLFNGAVADADVISVIYL